MSSMHNEFDFHRVSPDTQDLIEDEGKNVIMNYTFLVDQPELNNFWFSGRLRLM